jgi:hypothetical protein
LLALTEEERVGGNEKRAGQTYRLELYNAAQKPEGQVIEASMAPKSRTTATRLPKVAFITRAGDLGGGIGYDK